MKKSLLSAIAALFVLFGISGCVKDGEETIVYLGYEDYIPPIESVIPQQLLEVFTDSIGEIYKGYTPHNLEGTFTISPKKRVMSNNLLSWPIDVVEPDMSIKICDQHNGVAVTLECAEATTTVTDSVYIMGHDDFFTIYFRETKQFEDAGYEISITRAMLFTGEICAEGIKNLKYADIIIDVHDNSEGLLIQYPAGQYFIYEDGTGLSARM